MFGTHFSCRACFHAKTAAHCAAAALGGWRRGRLVKLLEIRCSNLTPPPGFPSPGNLFVLLVDVSAADAIKAKALGFQIFGPDEQSRRQVDVCANTWDRLYAALKGGVPTSTGAFISNFIENSAYVSVPVNLCSPPASLCVTTFKRPRGPCFCRLIYFG